MARSLDPTFDLDRIRKQQSKTRRAPLRIMIAGDPQHPIRTISLPRHLPAVALVSALLLVTATIVLACGSWKLNGALGALQHRVRAMVAAVDSVALRTGTPGVANAATGFVPTLRPPGGETGTFEIESANNGETATIAFNLNTGEIEPEGYRRFRHLMRCLRTGAETPIDPRLIDLLYRIARRTQQKIILISGFRAPMYSLATLSYHTRGMAADIRIPGMTPLMVRDLALSMGVGGVGYYPVSRFVHVDVREGQQRWIDYGKDRQDGEGAEHGPQHGEREHLEETGEADEGTAAAAPTPEGPVAPPPPAEPTAP
ncbi:MAG TPA: DUF882 domain-containing protein [Polyangia bacterium]|nr:DUF882 domain-containing protein [Polyangia bacterium]